MSQPEQLPNDIEACHALILQQGDTTDSLARDNERLKLEIEQLKRYIYGRRSERHVENDSQLTLFDDSSEAEAEPGIDDELIEEEITYRRRRRSKSDRFPENLPREVKTIDVPEEERNCPCCGEEMPIIGTDVRERLEYVPAKMFVHEQRYPKRACGQCKQGVTVAPPPASDQDGASLTAGSRYGFGVTAQIVLGKYADHLPLYRLEDVFARAGVVIPRSTQVGLLDAAADLVQPLTDYMKSLLIASDVIGMDDTPVRLQDATLPGKMRTARVWLARGRDQAPYNVFFFHESRERDGPSKFLASYNGWVTVDAYGVNDGVYLGSDGRIRASCCHAHARRKFEAALSNDPKRASRGLAFYRQLYEIEDRGSALSADQRWELRRAESLPVLDAFKAWLDAQAADSKLLPKSAIGGAVRYALNLWQPLMSFTLDGRLPIDNNDTERDLRRLTIGRKNWRAPDVLSRTSGRLLGSGGLVGNVR
ncbi:MAG: IS66 family transposase [Planctomycetaceae bacterium]|nr:IS66 family transposase [Planctomycetales bacterium]MCB9872679.1 IS66 family transposase [Planctomycetaceae bacterium]MCB9926164.1 IS66 family transposase [Planctomycetaceae bacterium]